MDDVENLPWSEDVLSNLKYNHLKKIAKEKGIVSRNIKKNDLIYALLQLNDECFRNSSDLPEIDKENDNSEVLRESKSILKTGIAGKERRSTFTKEENDLKAPRTPTVTYPDDRRLTFSTRSSCYSLRSYLKSGPVENISFGNTLLPDGCKSESRAGRKRTLRTGRVGQERRSTFTVDDYEPKNISGSEVCSEKKNSLRIGMVGTERRSTFRKDDSDPKATSVLEICSDEKNSLRTGTIGTERRSTFSKDDADSKNISVLELHSDKRNSLRTGVIGTERRSTFTKDDSDPKDTNVLEVCSEKKNSLLRTGTVGTERRSTFTKDDSDDKDISLPEEITGKKNSLRSAFGDVEQQSNFTEEDSDEKDPCFQEEISGKRNSLRTGVIGAERQLTFTEDVSDEKDTNLQEEITGKNNSPKTDEIWPERRSTITEDVSGEEDICLPEEIADEKNSPRTAVIAPKRQSTFTKGDCDNDASLSQSFMDEGSLIRHTPLQKDKSKNKKGVTFQTEDIKSETLPAVTPKKTIVKTPHKVKVLASKPTPCGKNVARNSTQLVSKTTSAKKMPNFSEIHKERFNKMESLVDMKKRFAEKARKMIMSPDVPKCAFVNKRVATPTLPKSDTNAESKPSKNISKTPIAKVVPRVSRNTPGPSSVNTPAKNNQNAPSSTKFNRFGFKKRMTKDFAKQIISKEAPVKSEKKKEENKVVLEGVRLNRRFTLQMQARGMHL